MTDTEADELFRLLDSGAALRVPFSTALYPDTVVHRNVLRKSSDSYELTTHYSEFAPGHGFSTELTERETLTREQLRQSLQWAKRDECATE
jgi:hypothetical protein